jgi:diaminohydroxyphosphoribosylaminopyrimidine deaminase / 5-amino-6-(5-phosphoribosylamino)uracil reductase
MGADEQWMRRALELAAKGRGTTSPNPMVGCVLVRDGALVAEGWHAVAGGPHAEAAALAAAGARAAGATAYVTLEPCAHVGRTGPCAPALVDAGVRRVVVALADPNPQAAGGTDLLRAAGVEVEVGVCAEEAARLNEVFLHGIATGRPFVIAKAAVSLDGRIAAADGTSQWLTGETARRRAHQLRAEVDAVLVGSGTVLADDPQLTCRLPGFDRGQPLRVVLDRRGRVTRAHRVLDTAADTVVLGEDARDLTTVLRTLWDREVRSLLVEGGAKVLHSFLVEGLVDRLDVHVAPLLLGDAGRPLLAGPWAETLAEAPRFVLDNLERAGEDTLLSLRPAKPAAVAYDQAP